MENFYVLNPKYKDLEEKLNNEELINDLYKKLDEEAHNKAEIAKQYYFLKDPSVLTLVKLKDGSYYCLETKEIGVYYKYKKGYADMSVLESFEIGKENSNEQIWKKIN